MHKGQHFHKSVLKTWSCVLQADLQTADSDVEMKRMRESEDDSEVQCLNMRHAALQLQSASLRLTDWQRLSLLDQSWLRIGLSLWV